MKEYWMMTWEDIRRFYNSRPIGSMCNLEETIANASQKRLLKYLMGWQGHPIDLRDKITQMFQRLGEEEW
jgi:hypothetical protein